MMSNSSSIIIVIVGSLTGCSDTKKQTIHNEQDISLIHHEIHFENKEINLDLNLCERELDSLAVLDPKRHVVMKKNFERVMRGAADYNIIRDNINSNTRDAIDALYNFHAISLCSEIQTEVLSGLIMKQNKNKG